MKLFLTILLGITALIWIIPVLLGTAVVCFSLLWFNIFKQFLTPEAVEEKKK